jgi:hypothetical protein
MEHCCLLAQEAGFEVFIRLDRGIEYEQNLSAPSIALIFISAKSSRLADLIPLTSAVIVALESIEPGQAVHVS